MRLYKKTIITCWLLSVASLLLVQAQEKILIVQDELPQIKALAAFLKEKGKLQVEIVNQETLPESLSTFSSLIVFIHGDLTPATENAIINYTKNGGRYICLHHSISSAKAKNDNYFDFLGIQLDEPEKSSQPVDPGEGYGWYHNGDKGIDLILVNLHPNHYITKHQIEWKDTINYTPSDFPSVSRKYPSLTIEDTEVYLNHKFTDGREKTVLAGFKFYDPRNQQLFMQDRAIWFKKYHRGMVIYYMPGENVSDYTHPAVARMILNGVLWKGE